MEIRSVDYKTELWGASLAVSKFFGAFRFGIEPFANVGLLHHSSSLAGSGTISLFGSSFPVGTTTVSATNSSLWLQAGALLKLYAFGIAAEYDRMFDVSSWSAKISIRI